MKYKLMNSILTRWVEQYNKSINAVRLVNEFKKK